MKKYLKDKINEIKLPYNILELKKEKLKEIDIKINRLEEFLTLIDNEEYYLVLREIEDVFKDINEERSNLFEVILKLKIAIKKGATIKLNENQINAYNSIISMIKDKINALTDEYCFLSDKYNEDLEKMENSNKESQKYERYLSIYNSYEEILDKDLLDEIYNDETLSNERKIELLKKIALYNERVNEGYKKMSLDELYELIPLLKLNNKYNNYKEILIKRYSYDDLKQIIDFINSNNKLTFEFEQFMDILLSGTNVDTLKKGLDKVLEKKMNLKEALTIQSLWVNGYVNERESFYVNSGLPKVKSTKKKTDGVTLYSNQKNSFENIEILTKLNLFDPGLNKIKKALDSSTTTLIRNKEAAELYGIKIIPSVLTCSRLMDNCDVYTELGHRSDLDCNSSYVNSHPKRFANIKRCQVQGIDYIGSRGSGFNTRVTEKETLPLEECIQLAQISQPDIENREEFDKHLMKCNPNVISNGIYLVDVIKYLEENNKKNNYEYIIGDCIVSRLKVLRIMNSLLKMPNIDILSAFRYSVFYNSYYTKQEIIKIEEEIKKIVSFGGYDEKSNRQIKIGQRRN